MEAQPGAVCQLLLNQYKEHKHLTDTLLAELKGRATSHGLDQQTQPIRAFDGPADTPRLPQALEEVRPTGTSSGAQTQHPGQK